MRSITIVITIAIIIMIIAIIMVVSVDSTSNKERFQGGECKDKDRCLPEDLKLQLWCNTPDEKNYLTPDEQRRCPK